MSLGTFTDSAFWSPSVPVKFPVSPCSGIRYQFLFIVSLHPGSVFSLASDQSVFVNGAKRNEEIRIDLMLSVTGVAAFEPSQNITENITKTKRKNVEKRRKLLTIEQMCGIINLIIRKGVIE